MLAGWCHFINGIALITAEKGENPKNVAIFGNNFLNLIKNYLLIKLLYVKI